LKVKVQNCNVEGFSSTREQVVLARPERIASLALYEPPAFQLLRQMGGNAAEAFAEITTTARRTCEGVGVGLRLRGGAGCDGLYRQSSFEGGTRQHRKDENRDSLPGRGSQTAFTAGVLKALCEARVVLADLSDGKEKPTSLRAWKRPASTAPH
jgi:hypothetical protein